jgi:hypothetical protein
MTTSQNRDIIDHMLANLEAMTECDHASDLHHYLCNEDYFIIGSFRARQWIGDEAFSIIDKIKEYEESNFGEVTTDFSEPEKVANMYCYIKGEEILQQANTLRGSYSGEVTSHTTPQHHHKSNLGETLGCFFCYHWKKHLVLGRVLC